METKGEILPVTSPQYRSTWTHGLYRMDPTTWVRPSVGRLQSIVQHVCHGCCPGICIDMLWFCLSSSSLSLYMMDDEKFVAARLLRRFAI